MSINNKMISFCIFKRSVSLIKKVSKYYIWFQLLLAILQSIFPVLSLMVMQSILNFLQVDQVNVIRILKWVFIYILIDIIQLVVQTLISLYSTNINLKFNLWIKEQILKKCSNLSIMDFENSEIYDLIQRAQNAENGSIIMYIDSCLQVLSAFFSIFSYLLILVTLDLKLIPIILFVPFIKYLITVKINKERFELIFNRTPQERKRWYYNYIITYGNASKELKLNNLYGYFISKYKDYTLGFNKQDYSLAKKSTLRLALFTLIEQLIDGSIFVYIISKGITGSILIGTVVTYTRSIIQAKASIQNVLLKYAEKKRLELTIKQIYHLLDLTEEVKAGSIKILSIESIEAINLSYKYKGNSNYALDNVSFSFKKGDIIAIAGQNGSGKTTLSKILLGLYLDYEGILLINGIEMRELELNTYRKLCSSLFQDFIKYEATVEENIIYGDINIRNNSQIILKMFNDFHLNRISEKGNNIDILKTQLGNWFESGKQISTGQWQRLALCRTFAKKADLYILDEPSASLDTLADEEITLKYYSLMQEHIGVIIAHRLQTISKYVTNIIVLQNGKVIETGSHKELLSRNGVYSKLYS